MLVDVEAGLDPPRTDDPAEASRLIAERGACILTGLGTGDAVAAGLAARVLGSHLVAGPAPVEVREAGGKDPKIREDDAHLVPLPMHTDGFTYGLDAPDTLFLLCDHECAVGGDSTLVDLYALLDDLPATAEGRALLGFLTDVELDLTSPGMVPRRGSVVTTLPGGRRQVTIVALRNCIAAAPDDPDAAEHERLVDLLGELLEEQRITAPRLRVRPGEVLCVDNYRVAHSRDGYEDLDRLFWRIWAWSDRGRRPPEGELASDIRYASAD